MCQRQDFGRTRRSQDLLWTPLTGLNVTEDHWRDVRFGMPVGDLHVRLKFCVQDGHTIKI